MTTNEINAATTESLLNVVLSDEKTNGCSDRVKLNRINQELMNREGKTAFELLTEKGL
jgi:hypothetical protein